MTQPEFPQPELPQPRNSATVHSVSTDVTETGHCSACCHAPDARSDHSTTRNPFFWPLMVIGGYAMVELVGGIWTHSLALLGDAWHMLADVSALALAMWASRRHVNNQVSEQRQRLVAMINGLAMLAITLWMIIEAFVRLQHPRMVAAGSMTIIALIGFIVNLWVARYMHADHAQHGHTHNHSLNHRAAFLHVLGDLLGSLVAVVAGVVIYFTGDTRIDPILSLLISALLLSMTLHLIRDIWRGHDHNVNQHAQIHAHDHTHEHNHTHHHHH